MDAGPKNQGEYKMAKKFKNPCKFCRRAGEKLFLKGKKCFTPHCPLTRRSYGPGVHGSKPKRISEYGSQLLEKQKLCAIYSLTDRQLNNYYQKAVKFKGKSTEALLSMLERRLDNVIFRFGLADSRRAARKIVRDRHILFNGKRVNIPSMLVKKNDEIKINSKSQDNSLFVDKPEKDWQIPDWLKWDKKKKIGTVIRLPSLEDIESKIDVAKIIEFYSR